MSVGVFDQALIYRDNFQLLVFTCPPLSASIGRLKMDKSLDRGVADSGTDSQSAIKSES